MSDYKPYTLTKFGDTRVGKHLLRKGAKFKSFSHEGYITLTEDCYINSTQKYNKFGEWETVDYDWSTLRPVKPKGPGFWARFWARLMRKVPLPQARLLKEKNA